MKHADIRAMMAEIAPVIREFTEAAVQPVMARLDALEKQLADLPAPRDGKDADEEAITARVAEMTLAELAELRAAVEAMPAPELPDIAGMVSEAVEVAVKAIPEPTPPDFAALVSDAVAAIPKPEGGKSVTVDDVRPLIDDAVREAVKAIPAPQDGKDGEPGPKGEKGDAGPGIDSIDVNLIDEGATAVFTFTSGDTERSFEVPLPVGPRGADGAPGEPGAKGEPGKDGRDGLDVKDLFRADGGRLMVVMSDGTTKDLGEFVGKNGADGAPGRDGTDGVGFDDMDLVVADDGAALVFTRGEEKKAFALPIVIDCGVYKQGRAYRKGNGVTWGGSFWIAQKDNPEGKPDAADSDWRLAVKKGQNGKDAEKGGA